jgi:hypothetical protein
MMETEAEKPIKVEQATMVEQKKDASAQDPPLPSTSEITGQAETPAPVPRIEKENETQTTENGENERTWVTGVPLFTMMAAITVCTFLMLLDTSIISTVWCYFHSSLLFFF